MLDLSIFEGDELLSLSKIDIDNNQLGHALAKVKTCLQLNDYPPLALSMAAKIYAQLRLFDKAATYFNQYLEVYPDAETDRFQLGLVTFESGNPKDALNIWKIILSDNSAHPPALFYSALALINLGDTGEAEAHLNGILLNVPADNLYFGKAKELLDDIQKTAKNDNSIRVGEELYKQ